MPQPVQIDPADFTGDMQLLAKVIVQQGEDIAALKKAAKAAASSKKK